MNKFEKGMKYLMIKLQIYKKFGSLQVLDNVNFHASRGEYFDYRLSGSGKAAACCFNHLKPLIKTNRK